MNLFDRIITNTYTVSDLHRRVRLVREYLTATFFAKGALPAAREEDQNWLLSLAFDGVTKNNLSDVLELLEKQANEIKPLIIFLAITPSQTEIEILGRRIRTDFGANLLIELRLDLMLIAGAALAYKGIYKDYSLRQKLKDNHDALLANFKKYLR